MMNMVKDVFIGLGSNLNNPVQQLIQACEEIAAVETISLRKVSSLYRNPPLGPPNQPDYVNAVVEIATSLSPEGLFDKLQVIEKMHGRVRSGVRWSARPLDLDILLYGEKVIRSEELTIPHLGLYERAFVLYPLMEIAPDLEVPGHGLLRDLVSNVDGSGLEKIATIPFLNKNDNET